MSNSDRRSQAPDAGRPPLKHRDGMAPRPDRANPQPTQPGTFEPTSGLSPEIVSGPLGVAWPTDQVIGAYPREAGDKPPVLASYADTSPERGPDPLAGASSSPPAPMQGTHPHLEAFAARAKKG